MPLKTAPYRIGRAIRWRRLPSDRWVVLDSSDGRYFVFSNVEARIWETLAEEKDWSALPRLISSEFEMTSAEALRLNDDLQSFTAELLKSRLVEARE